MASGKGARVRKLSLEKRNNRFGWFFIAPFVVGVVLIYAGVIIDSLRISFSDIDVSSGGRYELIFTGLANYKYAFFTDPSFVRELISSLLSFVTQVPVTIFFSLFITVILNQKMKGRGIFRAIFLLPVILSTGLVSYYDMQNMLMQNYQGMQGIQTGAVAAGGGLDLANISTLLQSMYIDAGVIDFLASLVENIYSIINHSGVQIILFLAGLQSISPYVYEAAKIEGATGWECFWKITIPMISPIILVNTVYSIIDLFTRSDNRIMLIISNISSNRNQGAGAAMSWVYFIGIALVLVLVALLGRRLVYYDQD